MKKDKNFLKVLEKSKFEEYKTPRVCFSNSIVGCLNAVVTETKMLTLHNKTLYVYTPEKSITEYKHKTNKQIIRDGDIFDANITNEMWILEPVKLKYVGSIVVDKVVRENIKKSANDKNDNIIKYDYKWHWFHKIKNRSVQNEACKDIKSAREFVSKVGELAKKYDANYFIVTDGASGIHNNGNPAVRNAREKQIEWERKNNFDPDEDWSKSIKESTSIINEVKKFPIEFDEDGNLTIYKCKTNNISYGDEINESVQLLESYRNTNNQEGLAYELSRVWFMITSIEKKLSKKKNLSEEDEKNLIRNRTTAINVFKTNLQYLMKLDNSFNFRVYYNNTPFSDNGYTITANTFKYSLKALKSIIM